MASTKFYLDTRSVSSLGEMQLKVAINSAKQTAMISLGISLLPENWDKSAGRVIVHPNRIMLNDFITKRKNDIDMALFELRMCDRGVDSLPAIKLKKLIMDKLNPPKPDVHYFVPRFIKFTEMHQKESTRGVYLHTLSRMKAFCGGCLDELTFEDITKDWLVRFDNFLAETSPSKNARNIHMRNIRAVFNDALDDEYVTCYPFRRFKIHSVPTAKRSLSVEELRRLWNCDVEEYAEVYRDMFKLIFCLCGINCVDLYNLKAIEGGRVNYNRAKTGKLYSIKVEPEALELIEKYRGVNGLVCLADRWGDHRNFRHQCNKALQRIGDVKRVGLGGKKVVNAAFPELTTYWARHTWATLAAELDIPDAVISQALGHSGENRTTDIYIWRNLRKVDDANRRVLDFVIYNKK